jgi:hypothetical protein
MATNELHVVLQQAQKLPVNEQFELIKCLAEKLAQKQKTQEARYLIYGEFANTQGRQPSTEEDFKLAEWHPTEAELNGE